MQARAAGSCDSKGKSYLLSGQKGLYPSQDVPGLFYVVSRTPATLFVLMAVESCKESCPGLNRNGFNGSRWLQSGQAGCLATPHGTVNSAHGQ